METKSRKINENQSELAIFVEIEVAVDENLRQNVTKERGGCVVKNEKNEF
jgi:hypothetical protein